MFTQWHNQWGYAMPEAIPAGLGTLLRGRVTPTTELELAGMRALERISQLPTEPDPLPDIDLSTLRCATALALDMTTIRHFANPSIMSGCVKLLKAAVGQHGEFGSESPLSYEYGALCFSIFTVCLDICLLERLNQVDEAMAVGERIPEVPAFGALSIKTAYEVHKQLTILENGGDCDWIFGWSSGTQPKCTPLLAPSDASDLMSILWNDRWYLLTISGLSNLLFLLTRHVFHERQVSGDLDPKYLAGLPPLKMLQLVTLATDSDSQDLLPEVIEHTIKTGWMSLLNPENDTKIIPGMLFNALATHAPYQLLPSIRAQIIDKVMSTDLLDMTARTIIQLDPAQSNFRSKILNSILFFYESLEDVMSKFELSQKLWDYVPVWRKYERHLFIKRLAHNTGLRLPGI
ncbi:hypothetical protein RSOL_282310, partial [Rhizoctonia solani AG-3 Rhs1AP]